MDTRRIIQLSVALLMLAVAGALILRWNHQSHLETSDAPEGTFWLCSQAECEAEFVMSLDALGEHYSENPGGPVACPECGSTETSRAARCPHCKRHFARPERGEGTPTCPHCKQALRPAAAGED